MLIFCMIIGFILISSLNAKIESTKVMFVVAIYYILAGAMIIIPVLI